MTSKKNSKPVNFEYRLSIASKLVFSDPKHLKERRREVKEEGKRPKPKASPKGKRGRKERPSRAKRLGKRRKANTRAQAIVSFKTREIINMLIHSNNGFHSSLVLPSGVSEERWTPPFFTNIMVFMVLDG